MLRRLCLASALTIAAAGPVAGFGSAALAQDVLGELTLHSPDGSAAATVDVQSMYFALQPPGAPVPDDKDQFHTVTITSEVHAPNPAVLAWLAGSDTKRQVTVHVQDGGVPAGSTYELTNARLTSMTIGFGRADGGEATLTIVADHMKINDFQVF